MAELNKVIKEVLLDLADYVEIGQAEPKVRIGLTIDGSELGLANMHQAVIMASRQTNFDIVVIGSKVDWLEAETIATDTEQSTYDKMEELLDNGYLSACITLHYNFPIGVATVGRIVTPAYGKEMIIATTTGTTSTNRTEAMILNTINGISVAKSLGIREPTVGVLNIEGARAVERSLREMTDQGYAINFGQSDRSDGGSVMRGNDMLTGTVDVMVCDSLTGNLIMKLMSANTSGGKFETTGYGYGPGVGSNHNRNILIISRASGAPVIANAMAYAYQLVKGDLIKCVAAEYRAANQAGLKKIVDSLSDNNEPTQAEVLVPSKEIVTFEITGIDVIELEDAVRILWENNIYAESGMGCTGPVILLNESNIVRATEYLRQANFIK